MVDLGFSKLLDICYNLFTLEKFTESLDIWIFFFKCQVLSGVVRRPLSNKSEILALDEEHFLLFSCPSFSLFSHTIREGNNQVNEFSNN